MGTGLALVGGCMFVLGVVLFGFASYLALRGQARLDTRTSGRRHMQVALSGVGLAGVGMLVLGVALVTASMPAPGLPGA